MSFLPAIRYRERLAAGYDLHTGSVILGLLAEQAGDGLSRAFPSPAESPRRGVPPVHPLSGRHATPDREAA